MQNDETREIFLNKLCLENFRGTIYQELIFTADRSVIFGTNAVGKTTVADAISWLLFGKDSKGNHKSQIKPLDELNQAIPDLETRVTAEFSVDGVSIEFSKLYRAKHIKRARRVRKPTEVPAYELLYFVDNFHISATEYARTVTDLAEEDLFRLLSDVTHFSTKLHWKERRNMLLQLSSTATEFSSTAVLNRAPELKLHGLEEALSRATPEQLELAAKDICKQSEHASSDLAARAAELTDECRRQCPEGLSLTMILRNQKLKSKPELPFKIALKEQLKNLDRELEQAQRNLFRLTEEHISGRVEQQVLLERAELEKALQNLRVTQTSSKLADYEVLQNQNQQCFEDLSRARNAQTRRTERRSDMLRMLKQTKEELKAQQAEYQALQNSTPEVLEIDTNNKICLLCKQPISMQHVEEQIESTKLSFNVQRAKGLEALQSTLEHTHDTLNGRQDRFEQIEQAYQQEESRILELERNYANMEQAVKDVREELQQLQSTQPLSMAQKAKIEGYTELQVQLEKLQKAQNTSMGTEKEQETVQKAIESLTASITEANKQYADIEAIESRLQRVTELQASEKQCIKTWQSALQRLDQLKQFRCGVAELLEEQLQEHFSEVQFRLFRKQADGKLIECCEALFGGVPYADLNTGAQINVGLDIIATFSKQHNISVPIIIDGAESIAEIRKTPGQQIHLLFRKDISELTLKTFDEYQNRN